jgi:hypothetical protein
MTKREQVLSMLENSDAVTGREFVDAGVFRYSARIKELRDRGYVIESNRISQGHYEFRLIGRSDEGTGSWVAPSKAEDTAGRESDTLPADPLPLEIPATPKVFACDLRNSPYWEED